MRHLSTILITCIFFLLQGCSASRSAAKANDNNNSNSNSGKTINTKNISANSVADFAETLVGVKYKYGSAVKENGFDCSGFITYVFGHFDIKVPRSSVEFTNVGTTVSREKAARGDLILFTGSDASTHIVGHMGIIVENKKGNLRFIHSASGNSRGVMVSDMNSYFTPRFVKVIRIFTQQ